jgi:mycothiol synthase
VGGLEDLTFRRPRMDDLEAVAAIFAAEERALRGDVTLGADELRDWWRLYDLEGGSWLVEDEGGNAVAFGGLMQRADDFDTWIGVDPGYAGRGISTELLGRAEREARDRGGARLRAGILVENDAGRTLLEGRGYREVRRFYRMQVDLDDDPPPPDRVEGIEIAVFRPEDAERFHAAMTEAFSEDWGFVAMPFDEWREHRLEAPETDTSLWFVARDDDAIAGTIRCDAQRFGGGFVGALSVRKPWRGRGVGMALLRHAFAEFHRRGAPHVSLGVDAQNESGATRLYERGGMRVVSEDVLFEKALA